MKRPWLEWATRSGLPKMEGGPQNPFELFSDYPRLNIVNFRC